MNDLGAILEREQFSQRFVFLAGSTSARKSDVQRLPSRLPITLDVNINGTATVRLFAGNITDDKDATTWGTHVREFTASEKVIIEDEPWLYWMVEHVSGSGTVNVVAGV